MASIRRDITLKSRRLLILGTRGIPAQHGGFETFAEYLALYLVTQGWRVSVYCQVDGKGNISRSSWNGIELIKIPVAQQGVAGTIIFDLLATVHSLRESALPLVLGYNTAIFGLLYRLIGRKHLINMDGIEWKRAKWGKLAKTWFYVNERIGCLIGNHLIADHPRIEDHLATRVSRDKITMIPYGANSITHADEKVLQEYSLEKGNYAIVVARAEPENSLLEIVKAFSQKTRNSKLIVLGQYQADTKSYHRQVLKAASEEVIFPGAIYDSNKLNALRFFARYYIHGHQVGGTNPSLVEALGAGNAVIAHDNPFNRWVAGEAGIYFSSTSELARIFSNEFSKNALTEAKHASATKIYNERFQWIDVLSQYEALLLQWHD